MTYRSIGLGIAVLVATLAASPPPAPPVSPAGGLMTKDMTIVTDTTDSNYNTHDFSMPHHVKFTRPGTTVVGDSAHGNTQSETVTITGHVVMNDDGNAPEGQAAGAPAGGGPSTLTCDQLEIDAKRKIYIASGNVHFSQGERHATAQYGKLDQGAHTLDLSGDVHLADGESTLSAQLVHYDTLTKDVHTEGTPVVMSEPAVPSKSTKPTPPAKKKP